MIVFFVLIIQGVYVTAPRISHIPRFAGVCFSQGKWPVKTTGMAEKNTTYKEF
jgi:hypothetical protein